MATDKLTLRTTKPKLPPPKVIDTVNKIRNGVSKLNQKMVPAPIALLEMISGIWVAQSVSTAAKLGVADEMSGEPTSVEQIAKRVNAKPEPLYRLMRALSTVGLFIESEGRKFALTSIGRCLRDDHPQSMRHMAIFQGQLNWANWGDLENVVRTGVNAPQHLWGEGGFEHLKKHPEKAEIFDRAMTNISSAEIDSVLAAYDFSNYKTIADVGGGRGALLASILAMNPQARGILFELPYVIAGAKANLAAAGIASRVDVQEGSFFETAPAGADAYVMKHIIHDWSDEEAVQIMKNIRAKIPAQGRLLLIEAVIPAPNVPHFSKFLDLEMLVVTTGRERTTEEFASILNKAGFALNRVVPTISMANIIEASPI